MAERIYPSAKPASNGTVTTNGGAANPSFPATKAQLYGATRPTYRPQPHHRRSRCRCCCRFLYWFLLTLLVLLLIIGVAGVIFYLIYRPHRPSFTVTSLKLSYLNLTSSSSTLDSKLDISVTARNPNKNIAFIYQPTSISILSDGVDIGDGTIPSFEHGKKNTTVLKATVSSSKQTVDDEGAGKLKARMRSKSGLPLEVNLKTKVTAKMGSLKTPKVGIRVSCDGIRVSLPSGKKPATASTSNAKCKVDVRFKIWKWTLG
ncbi:NDR1/HIN1-like protein 10 [Prosopis cineraria]|uniref:NDR1/HIN1-like protein 10 n=1 Tax=Prosopis cineraria TaxID=364024 RepID=UPI0024106422|nr:NDR1/HIN1-like protein 10 [Prosopis cineraria]